MTKCKKPQIPYGNIGNITTNGKNSFRELADCDKLTTKLLSLEKPMCVTSTDSFISLIILSGNINIMQNNEKMDIKKGDSIFIPANLKTELKGNAEILYSHI